MSYSNTEPIVQKYGGSSLSTADKIRRVARKIVRVRDSGRPVVVVVSAMGDTTSRLIEQAREVSDDPSRRELDVLLSSGEQMSISLLAMAVQAADRPAISLTGPECGIVTDSNHANAKIVGIRPDRVHRELARGRIVIVAGFQGATPAGEITTLGRGGSDTTAVALAAALGARTCEIYSDVPGIFTADPRVVDEPRHLKRIESRLMSEYALHGARVLHTPCLEHARSAGIAIRALATFGDDTNTTIVPGGAAIEYSDGADGEVAGMVGVASRLPRIRVHGNRTEQVDTAAILECLDGLDLFRHPPSPSDRGLDVLIGLENVPDPTAFSEQLRERLDGLAEVTSNIASVSAIADTRDMSDLSARVRDALDSAGTEVLSIYRRPLSVTCAVRDEDCDAAVKALHASLLTSPQPSTVGRPAPVAS